MNIGVHKLLKSDKNWSHILSPLGLVVLEINTLYMFDIANILKEKECTHFLIDYNYLNGDTLPLSYLSALGYTPIVVSNSALEKEKCYCLELKYPSVVFLEHTVLFGLETADDVETLFSKSV